MSELKDQILTFVKAKDQPLAIREIADGIGQSGNMPAVNQAVMELHREGVLFRSLSGGKALFSADKQQGEGLTPVQIGNASVAGKLNSLVNGKPIGGAQTVSEYTNDEPLCHRPFDIELTFSQGRRLEFKDYSIAVPDGFEAKENVNGRDFIIWMPPMPNTDNADELDGAGVPVMSPFVLKETALNNEAEAPNKAIRAVLFKKAYAYAMASSLIRQNLMGTIPIILNTRIVPAFYMQTFMANYSVNLIFNDCMKCFTCSLNPELKPSTDEEKEKLEAVLATWINTIELSKPYPVRTPLDDPKFFKNGVTQKAISAWGKYAADWSDQSTFLTTQTMQYEVYRYNATHPVWSFTACKPRLLSLLEWDANYYNQMLAETWNCVEKLQGSCPDDMLIFLCKQALEIAAIDQCSRTFGDDDISLKTDAPKIREKIKEILQKIEKKDQQKKQELRQSIKSMSENLHSELKQRIAEEEQAASARVDEFRQRLTQATQNEMAKLEQELAAAQAESNSIYNALNSMGLFQVKQKLDARAKLQQLRMQIEQLNQSRQTPDSADIRQAKAMLEHAEKELAACSTNRKKWESAVEQACSIYEKRVMFHLDYIAGKKLTLASKLSESVRKDYELMHEVYFAADHATLSEMCERSYTLGELDKMRVAAITRNMLDNGYLSRTVWKGKAYFDREECPPELVDDTDWDITQPPVIPDLNSILSDA